MSDEARDEILQKLREAVKSGDPGRLGVDYWDRGGPPGQGYESDVLIARPEATALLRTRFDKAYAPPFRVEEYTDSGDLTVRGALLVGALAAFDKTFPEEAPLPIGGVTKISIKVYVTPPADAKVTEPPPEIVKTFFAKVPDELVPLRDAAKEAMDALATRTPNILSQRAG